jgi:hypothetical protein
MRGNYPGARLLFGDAIAAAARAGADDHVRAGHQGLLMAALAARDVDTALAHGWSAFEGIPPNASDARAEMLATLGDVGRQAGEYRASLGAALAALELTDTPRIRLPALGTAAAAAAHLREVGVFRFVLRDAARTIDRSGQPFENARTLVELAEAAVVLGASDADQLASRALALASVGDFHEVTARAEAVHTALRRGSQDRAPSRPTAVPWSRPARSALTALETLSRTSLRAAEVGR